MLDRVYKIAYIAGHPNLAEYIRTATAVPPDSAIQTAATDGYNVFYNPKFLAEIKDVKRVLGLFAHEYYHIVYDHVNRGRDKRAMVLTADGKPVSVWNLCADVIVNESVRNRCGFKLPKEAIERGKGCFKDLPADADTTTKIYNWFLSQSREISQEEYEQAMQHAIDQAEAEAQGGSGGADGKGEQREAQASEAGKNAGDSAELREAMELAPSDLNWIDLVKAMQIESGRLVHRTHKRSYSRPARYEQRSIIRPHNKRYQHHPRVDVYIDVSGSMGDNPLQIFAGLKSILSRLRIYRPRFFSFNSDIRMIDMKSTNFGIGGGTDIKKVLRKISEDKSDLAIVITDCEDTISKDDFKDNVIVVSDKSDLADYYTNNWKLVRKCE